MGSATEKLSRLRDFNAWVHRSDPKLAEESADLRPSALEGMGTAEDAVALESIVLRRARPVLAIKKNEIQLDFVEREDSEIWRDRLNKAKALLDAPIRAVGRIDLQGARLDWVGTGWLVAENIVVTNRHVAREFAARKGDGYTFRMGLNGLMSADVDFLQEINNPDRLVFKLKVPLHIEEEPGPDIAFFEVEITGGDPKLAAPIELAGQLSATENVAAIGYPAYDSRIPEPDLMEQIFGKTYNKKRLAPGAVTNVEETRILHNCTTLGGNSGSAVIDLDSGRALGLHFSGSFLATNYAVRADVVKQLLAGVRTGRPATRPEAPVRKPQPTVVPPKPALTVVSARPAASIRPAGRGGASLTIPLTVTVSLGQGTQRIGPAQRYWPPAPVADDSEVIEAEEARAEDYSDRLGYDPEFLGDGKMSVDLPSVERDSADVLDFQFNGETDTQLRYEHYSVVMSRSRRMCFFSAVNIDGNLSKKSPRVPWKWDPRIPKAQQIMRECYGSPPKFSRGHMTRREDPGWGDKNTARRGNEDSMHVTNTTPQMQAFNAPIWLALEDYALQHAREDEMKISVFTGPYFSDNDPEMYGVRIPRAFWKIIAFIHDDTGKLSATGYEMNQEQSLQPEEEFVFGAFTSPQLHVATQIPIRSIEARSGVSFGKLASIDPLAGTEEGLGDGASRPPLLSLEQIVFAR